MMQKLQMMQARLCTQRSESSLTEEICLVKYDSKSMKKKKIIDEV